MRIIRAALRAFALPLVRPISTAHGTLQSRAGFLISVEDEAGRVAHGEATPFPEFGTENLSTCAEALKNGLSVWLAASTNEPDKLGEINSTRGTGGYVRPRRSDSAEMGGVAAGRLLLADFGRSIASKSGGQADAPCARAALEAAFCDLQAQATGESLSAWIRRAAGLTGEGLSEVPVQALVQGSTPLEVEVSAQAAMERGFGTFKLKLAVEPGRHDLGMDLERVAALRSAAGPGARVRLDANEAWTRNEAERAISRLAEFQIDYLEQPVAREALGDLAALGALGEIGIAADEALLGAGLNRCLEARAASILIVKPSALGGVLSALDLVERARADDLRIVWSNLFEGVVGRSLAAALASATSEVDEVHGLGTAGLLARDFMDWEGAERVQEERGGVLSGEVILGKARALAPAWSDSDAPIWEGEVWEARR